MCSKSNKPRIYLPIHTDEGFKYSDEYESTRGKYKLNQTLDYDSLQYSPSLDYPIEIDGVTFYPGQSYEKYLQRKRGNHARADWAWRWSKELFEFGLREGFIVVKHYDTYSRIYTKTYQNATIVKSGKDFKVAITPRTRSISSLEYIDNAYSNDNSKKNLLSVFETSVFDYSKPISLLESLIKYSTRENDIIIDFFSGSATTAHAVMQLNAEDGGHRKFIMVQLPEQCDEKSEAYKAGYKNICEIGKERIRRAGTKIKNTSKEITLTHVITPDTTSETGKDTNDFRVEKTIHEHYKGDLKIDIKNLSPNSVDTGFRVLKLDSSNMQDVYYTPAEFTQATLDGVADNIKPDRTPMDLLFQVMLDLGVLLSSDIKETTICGKTVFNVEDNYLIACFDENITDEVITAIAKKKPYYFVMRDSSMADDSVATNFEQIFATYSPDTVRRVL